MSIVHKIRTVLLPESWSQEKRQQYLEHRNFKGKFGNRKSEIVKEGFVHYIQGNKKGNSELPLVDLEDGAKCYIEQKKVSYKQKRQPRKIKLDETDEKKQE